MYNFTCVSMSLKRASTKTPNIHQQNEGDQGVTFTKDACVNTHIYITTHIYMYKRTR